MLVSQKNQGLTDAAWQEFLTLHTKNELTEFFSREDIWEDEEDDA
jgi:hypothetical protein